MGRRLHGVLVPERFTAVIGDLANGDTATVTVTVGTKLAPMLLSESTSRDSGFPVPDRSPPQPVKT